MEGEHLVSRMAKLQSHMASGVPTTQSDFLEMLDCAHQSNTLDMVPSPESGTTCHRQSCRGLRG